MFLQIKWGAKRWTMLDCKDTLMKDRLLMRKSHQGRSCALRRALEATKDSSRMDRPPSSGLF